MRNLIITNLFLLIMILGISCQPERTQTKQEPAAEVGWDGKQQVVRVTDDNGQQFLMNYLIYQQLFNNGGYSNVIHHYHSEPSKYRAYSGTSFRKASVQPSSTKNFNYSYRKVEARRNAIARAKSSYSYPKSTTKKSTSSSFFKKSSYKPSRSSWSRSSSSSRRRR